MGTTEMENGMWQWWGETRLSCRYEYVMIKGEFMAKDQDSEKEDKKTSRLREKPG